MKITLPKRQPCPCPEGKWPSPRTPDPNCICSKPMLLYIPPGQHIHCPVHPDVIIHGSSVMC